MWFNILKGFDFGIIKEAMDEIISKMKIGEEFTGYSLAKKLTPAYRKIASRKKSYKGTQLKFEDRVSMVTRILGNNIDRFNISVRKGTQKHNRGSKIFKKLGGEKE